MQNRKFNGEIKLIAFDADDTLWINEYHYRKAEEKFAELMSLWCDKQKAIDILLRKEKENLPLLGYGSKPFIISLIESGIEISKGNLLNEEITQLIEIGKDTIGQEIELLPNVNSVLETLYSKYPLLLATKGDLKEQESKVERSGLKGFFSYIEIMSEKNNSSYLNILSKLGVKPQNFLMIGNSFKSDILPVLEIGGSAIYIPAQITWAHEVIEEQEHPNLIKTDNLNNIPLFFNINHT